VLEGFGVFSSGGMGNPGVIDVGGLVLIIITPLIEPLLDLDDAESRESAIGRSGVFGTAFRWGSDRAGTSIGGVGRGFSLLETRRPLVCFAVCILEMEYEKDGCAIMASSK
jgi:hypothetical protein